MRTQILQIFGLNPDTLFFSFIAVVVVLYLFNRRFGGWANPVKVLWIFKNYSGVFLPAAVDLRGVFVKVLAPQSKKVLQVLLTRGLPIEVKRLDQIHKGSLYLVSKGQKRELEHDEEERRKPKKERLEYQKQSDDDQPYGLYYDVRTSKVNVEKWFITVEGEGRTINVIEKAKEEDKKATEEEKASISIPVAHEILGGLAEIVKMIGGRIAASWSNQLMMFLMGLMFGISFMGVILPRLFGA